MGLGTALWHWLSTKFWFDWVCLFLIINPYFLCYYGYDSIGAMLDATEKLFHTDKAGISLLYAMHGIPVIFTVFFIGVVIDKFGTQRTALVLSITTLLGSICVATGHKHFGILILGRLLFGFGSESMSVTAQKMLSHKFKDSMLSLAFGFQILWGQFGSCIVFVLMPIFNEKYGTIGALWSVPIYAIFSLLTTLMYYWIDTRQDAFNKIRYSPPVSPDESDYGDTTPSESIDKAIIYDSHTPTIFQHSAPRSRETKHSPHAESNSLSSSPNDSDDQEFEGNRFTDGKGYMSERVRQKRIANYIRNETPSTTDLLAKTTEDGQLIGLDANPITPVPSDRFELKDLKNIPFVFWILLVLYFSVSTTYFTWNSFGSDRLSEKYKINSKKAGTVVALSNMAAMASPLTGFFVDRIGHRTKFILSGVTLMLWTYCALTWTTWIPALWYILLGIGVALCQPIVFASVSLVVKESINGTAFALMSAALNLGQVVMPVVVGALHNAHGSYQTSNFVFVGLATVALIFAIVLLIIERRLKLLDEIGLWRNTAPPSVYSDLFARDKEPPALPAAPIDIESEKLLPVDFLPNSYSEATHMPLNTQSSFPLSASQDYDDDTTFES